MGADDSSSETTLNIGGVSVATIIVTLILIAIPLYLFLIKPQLAAASEKKKQEEQKKKKNLLIDQSNTVPVEDLAYLASVLSPDSTHMQVLLAVLTTPENLEWSCQDIERVAEAHKTRAEKDKGEDKDKTKNKEFDDLFNQDGWADDEEEEQNDALKKANEAEKERKLEMERLKQATGQAIQLLEGVDDGVLGQKWVEKSLEAAGVWPPKDLAFLEGRTFEYNGKTVSALEHPGLRRLLCMTIGRLNSLYLNGHPQLLEAGSKKLIDQTYFKASMEFRQRAAMVLEACLRVGMMLRSSRLVGTVVETVSMFKIGTGRDQKALQWFDNLMIKQYNVLPRMNITSKKIETPDEKEIVAGDIAEVILEFERPHAENFLRQKIAMFQKQGIPPQVGLSTYREGWWFILRLKRLDGESPPPEPLEKDSPVLKNLNFDADALTKFENEPAEHRILTAWPMIVQNVAQKSGKVKIQFKVPEIPGKYQYLLAIKSQEFMGADQDFNMDITVVDSAKAGRPPKEAPKREEAAAAAAPAQNEAAKKDE